MTCRLPTLLALTLALGACTARTPPVATGSPRYASLDSTLDAAPPRSGAHAPGRRASPVAVLPAWIGRPIRLRERDDAGGFEQAVSLGATPRGETRENLVMVAAPRPGAAADGSSGVMGKPTEGGIRAEMEAAFPGLAMQVVTRPAANAYGPYGLAIGRGAGGARCLYAWQWIEAPPALETGADGLPLSLRVRLCRTDITLEAMAAAVDQLRLVPRHAGQPVEATRHAGARPPAGPGRRPDHGRRIATHRAVLREAPALTAPPVGRGAAETAGERRYLGADTAQAAPSQAPPAVRMRVDADRSTLVAGPDDATHVTASGTISADLPPEAYRGPSGVAGR